jgi:hypothetical protein
LCQAPSEKFDRRLAQTPLQTLFECRIGDDDPVRNAGAWRLRARHLRYRKLQALDFGLPGLADDYNVVIIERLAPTLLSRIDEPGPGIFTRLD